MIIIVTPNPAIDITYEVAEPRLGETNRVTRAVRRPGGKGLNVASVLDQVREIDGATDRRIRVSGFLGGRQGEEMHDLLANWPVEQCWLDRGNEHPTRATVAVMAADGEVTMLNEAGPQVDAEAWQQLAGTALEGASRGDVLVVSGSCPPGTTPEDLAQLLQSARDKGLRVVLDTSGPLLVACAGLADAVKPNLEELVQATGQPDLAGGVSVLLGKGVRAVAVSDGPRGMDLFTPGQDGKPVSCHVPAPRLQVVNPTGAGDSAVAAIAAFMDEHPEVDPVDERALVAAVALSAAAVRTPVAGLVETSTYQNLLTTLKAEKTNAAD